MTSFQWRHHHYVTEKCHKNYVTIFSNLGPLQSKFLATPVISGIVHVQITTHFCL